MAIYRQTAHGLVAIGDEATPAPATSPESSIGSLIDSSGFRTASGIALTFHGYRRTGSILWALIYGAAGRYLPTVAVPVSLAQGFGKKRTCDS